MLRGRNAFDRRVVRLMLAADGETKCMERAPVVVAGGNEPLADFDTNVVQEMIRSLTKLQRAMERSAAQRGIIASGKA